MVDTAISVPVIAFHKVDSSFEWGVTRVTPPQFERVISHLSAQGFTSVTFGQLSRKEKLPAKPIILTFDDGYESVYTSALPILRRYGFTACVFVITSYTGRLNTWDVNLGGLRFRHLSADQIRKLHEAGIEIGSHTAHHPDLTRISPELVKKELTDSKKTLSDLTGTEVTSLAFPFGRYNRAVLTAAADAGYVSCSAFWRKPWVDEYKEIFVFERKAYYLFDTILNLRAKYGNGIFTGLEQIKLRIINFCSHGTALVKPCKY